MVKQVRCPLCHMVIDDTHSDRREHTNQHFAMWRACVAEYDFDVAGTPPTQMLYQQVSKNA